MTPPVSGSSYYDGAFPAFFDRHWTGWVDEFSPELERYLAQRYPVERSVLDLCCGTGRTAGVFLRRGWAVTGVDLSAGMLDLTRRAHGAAFGEGRLVLVESDAVTMSVPTPVQAVVSLDGALNHLLDTALLRAAFERVAAALVPGGNSASTVVRCCRMSAIPTNVTSSMRSSREAKW